ncbi:preprotein translocase subunit SecG [Candidatus Soleaferrea massiliensis]|uniref:preprotein translocase subunit SecG n=1 Tax=Candidatus Soleaferrea massiliensis TaxID=1470354 RepID=UPI000590C982|nr:preprotein translocase subunit SecG [Candidatus Soleaferrea massiliensis]
MGLAEIILGVALILICIFLIIVVLLQESKTQGMNVITGGTSESYLGKNQGRTMEALLKRITKIAAILFIVLAVAINVYLVFFAG